MAASERLILSTMPNGSKKNSVSHTSGTAMIQPRPGLSRGRRKFTLDMHYPPITSLRLATLGQSIVQDDGALLVPVYVYRLVPARTITASLGIGNTRLDPLTIF